MEEKITTSPAPNLVQASDAIPLLLFENTPGRSGGQRPSGTATRGGAAQNLDPQNPVFAHAYRQYIRPMQISDRKIGPAELPLGIAEIGINHGGDLDVASHMMAEAARAGAEIVKHQTHFVWDVGTDEAKGILPPNLSEGYVIAEADIWGRRLGSSEITGYDFDKVVGRRLTQAVSMNTQLKWSDLD